LFVEMLDKVLRGLWTTYLRMFCCLLHMDSIALQTGTLGMDGRVRMLFQRTLAYSYKHMTFIRQVDSQEGWECPVTY
jgi:hypothetical protein